MTTISSPDLTATIADLGAEMQGLRFRGRDLLWHGDAEWWTGRSPVLFPIVGRAPGDVVEIDGTPVEMAQHGFARRLPFEVIDRSDAHVTHRLASGPQTASYPHDFTLDLTHRVTGATLEVAATVTNLGPREMPFGLGFHPAFLWPLPGAGADDAHEITLANGAEPQMARIRDGLIMEERVASPFTHGRLELSHGLFAANAAVFPEGAGEALRYAAPGVAGAPSLDFRFIGLPNVALWQPPGAPFLCIEPWHGMAAIEGHGRRIEDRPGTILLPPGQAGHFAWTVTVSD